MGDFISATGGFFAAFLAYLIFYELTNSVLYGLLAGFLAYCVVAYYLATHTFSQLLDLLPKEPPPKAPQKPAKTPTPSPPAVDPTGSEFLQSEATETQPTPPEKPAGALLLGIPAENQHERLWLPKELQERHCYIIGKTRTGKTTLMTNLIQQDMENGHGVCFVDPHGDASESLLSFVPKERVQDVIYFDPSKDWAPPFNIFQLPYRPDKLTEDFISILRMSFDSWGPRLEHITRYGVLTLICNSKPRTLSNLRTLFVNPSAREEILSCVTEPTLLEFWEHEFPNLPRDVAAPLINKLSTFLVPGSPMLRLFSQPENALDFTRIMNEQKILVVNLAKGILGDEPSRLLGGMIVASVAQAGLARAELPPAERKEFHLWIDEFQNFLIDSIQTILSEAGKYRLRLFMANQTTQQLGSDILASVLGNVATLISFQISADDAGKLKREMHRTRAVVHLPLTPQPVALPDFIQTENYRLLEEKKKFQAYADAAYERWYNTIPSGDYEASDRQMEMRHANEQDMREYDEQLRKISEQLQTLNNPQLANSANVLRSAFPSYRFLETDYPDVGDFLNLPFGHAFCRMERAENVSMFCTFPPPEPIAGTSGQILHAMREAHAERLKKQQLRDMEACLRKPTAKPDTQVTAAEEPEAAPTTAQPKKKPLRSVPKTPPKTEEEFEF